MTALIDRGTPLPALTIPGKPGSFSREIKGESGYGKPVLV